VVIITSLLCIGIAMVYGSSGIYALQEMGNKVYFLNRHLLFLFIGSLAALGTMAIDYRDLKLFAKPLLLAGIVMLVLVLIPGIGKASFGARRWFKVGPFNFQPSEFVKLAILIYMAEFLSRKQNKIKDFVEGFLPLIMVMGLLSFLIVKQPDLGNALLIALIILIMMFVAGARILHVGILVSLGLPALGILIYSAPYRVKRIMAFLHPDQDVHGIGFQLAQSQIALGSGGIFGVGLGKSAQKLFYLPAAHTDFILSIIGEELGLLGTLVIVFLFVAFIWQAARIAKRTTDPFGFYLALGIIVMLGLQAVVNIGVSIGALPTKGLPLPFISYGGSALIFHLISVALLLNISRIQDLEH
jgi:cell division protein FtsW